MANDKVKIPVELAVEDVSMAGLDKSAGKGLSKILTAVKTEYNKILKSTTKKSIDALFGKDVVGQIQAQRDAIKAKTDNLRKDYDWYKSESKKVESQIASIQHTAAVKAQKAQAALDNEKTRAPERAAEIKKLTQQMNLAKGPLARAKSDDAKQRAQNKIDKIQDQIRILQSEAKSFQYMEDIYKKEVASGGYDKNSRAELAEAQANLEDLQQTLKDTKAELRGNTKEWNLLGKQSKVVEKFQKVSDVLQRIGSIVGKIGGAIGKVFKLFPKFGKTGRKTTGSLQDGFRKLGKNILTFGLGFRTMYYLIKRLRQIFTQEMGKMSKESDTINQQISNMVQSFKQFKSSVAAAIQPIASVLMPILTEVFNKLSGVMEQIANFNAQLTGQSFVMKATTEWQDYSASIDEANKKLGGYDKLQVIGQNDATKYEEAPVEELSDESKTLMESLQNLGETFKNLWNEIQPKIAELVADIKPTLTMLLDAGSQIVTNLTPAITEIVGAIKPVVDAILPAMADIMPVVAELISSFVQLVAPTLVSIIQQVVPVLKDIALMLLPKLNDVIKALQPVFDVLVQSVLPVILNLVKALLPIVDGILTAVIAILTPILSLIAPLLELVSNILDPIIELLTPILDLIGFLVGYIGEIIGLVLQLFTPVLNLINSAIKPLFSAIKTGSPMIEALVAMIKLSLSFTKQLISFIINRVIKTVNTVIDIVNVVSNTFSFMFEGIQTGFRATWNFIRNIINSILGGVESMVNGIVKGINVVINALNNLSVDVPDWVTKITGMTTFGFNLSPIKEASIPRLAQGAVIPPNKEFLATLGDQKSGTNIEAPLDTIKQALAEVLTNMGGNNEPILLQLDGRTIAQVVWDESNKRYKQTGSAAYSY